MEYKDYLKAFTDITELIPKTKRLSNDVAGLKSRLFRAVDDYIWAKVNDNTKEMLYNKEKEIKEVKGENTRLRKLLEDNNIQYSIDPYRNSGKYKGD